MAHRARPALASRHPVHVTLKLDPSLPDLRGEDLSRQIQACLAQGKEREGFRLVHYSIQTHHLHLIVEAARAETLTRGIRGLCVRLVRHINRACGRKGRVFVERYFARALKTPREVRRCLCYVLNNVRRHAAQHGRRLLPGWIDDCSSGRFFDGWRDGRPALPGDEEPSVAAPCVASGGGLAQVAPAPRRRGARARAVRDGRSNIACSASTRCPGPSREGARPIDHRLLGLLPSSSWISTFAML